MIEEKVLISILTKFSEVGTKQAKDAFGSLTTKMKSLNAATTATRAKSQQFKSTMADLSASTKKTAGVADRLRKKIIGMFPPGVADAAKNSVQSMTNTLSAASNNFSKLANSEKKLTMTEENLNKVVSTTNNLMSQVNAQAKLLGKQHWTMAAGVDTFAKRAKGTIKPMEQMKAGIQQNIFAMKNMRALRTTADTLGTSVDVVRDSMLQLGASFQKADGRTTIPGYQVMGATLGQLRKKVQANYNPFNELRSRLVDSGIGYYQATKGVEKFRAEMGEQGIALTSTGRFYDMNRNKLMAWGDVTKKAGRMSMRPFAGHLLSLMFVAQGVANAFGQMINPVLEVAGVFDVWRAMLISVLGPVLFPLADILIDLMSWFMDLPDPVKKVIGVFVLIAYAVFQVLAAITPFLLLLSSFGVKLLGAGGILTKFWGWFTAGKGAVGIFWGVISKIVGFIGILWGAFRIFIGWLESDWWKIISGVMLLVAGIVALVLGGWIPAVIAIVVGALVWLGDTFPKVAAVIMAAMTPVVAPFLILQDTIKAIISLLTGGGWKGVKSAFTGGAFSGFLGAIADKWNGTKMAAGGLVTRPTPALIGEAGPEAVIPLNKMSSMGGETNIDYSPNITIQAGAGMSSGDLDRIVREVNSRLYNDLRRVGIR